MVLQQFVYRGRNDSTPYNRHVPGSPITSLVSSFCKKQVMEDVGGLDVNFLGVYWDMDWMMRFYEYGGHVYRINSVASHELVDGISGRLYRITKRIDRATLDSFWVRKVNDKEIVPSETAWCFYGSNDIVLSKYRVKKFEGFVNDGITEYSQGIKSYGAASWV